MQAPEADVADFDALMARAEDQRESGEYSEAARSYAAAYRALAEEERVGLMGELVLENALADYGQGYEKEPSDLALLEESVVLLEMFVATRKKAIVAGRAEALPPGLEEELKRLRARLDRARLKIEVTELETESTVVPEPIQLDRMEESDQKNRRPLSIALLSAGVVATAVGAGLLGEGIAFSFISGERVEAQVAQADEMAQEGGYDSEGFDADTDAYRDRMRRRNVGLITGGSVLLAGGIAASAVSTVMLIRARSNRRERAHLTPSISRSRLLLSLSGWF